LRTPGLSVIRSGCFSELPQSQTAFLDIDDATGEMFHPPVTRYGDISNGKIFGLICDGKHYLTRQWLSEIKQKEPEPLSTEDEYSALIMHSWGALVYGAERATLEYCQ